MAVRVSNVSERVRGFDEIEFRMMGFWEGSLSIWELDFKYWQGYVLFPNESNLCCTMAAAPISPTESPKLLADNT